MRVVAHYATLDGMGTKVKKHYSATGRRVYGAAVPGAVERPTNFPRTLVVMISDEMAAELDRVKASTGESKAAIARRWLEAGQGA